MEIVPPEIVSFIKKHHVLTLATSTGEEAWCSQVFYVFDPEKAVFYFSTSKDTKHGKQMCHNCFVAASIVLESRVVGMVQGLQIQGIATKLHSEAEITEAERLYTRRFPIANFKELHLWRLDATRLKFTNNRLGFGNKLEWYRDSTAKLLEDIAREGMQESEKGS